MAASKDAAIARLKIEVRDLRAQLQHRKTQATVKVQRLNRSSMLGSGVLIEMYRIGQSEPEVSVVVGDGLSESFINSFISEVGE